MQSFDEYISDFKMRLVGRGFSILEVNEWINSNASNLFNTYQAQYDFVLHNEPGVTCQHEFINVGFTSRTMVCKHCEEES